MRRLRLNRTTRPRRRLLVGSCVPLVGTLTACGDNSDSTSTTTSPATTVPATTTAASTTTVVRSTTTAATAPTTTTAAPPATTGLPPQVSLDPARRATLDAIAQAAFTKLGLPGMAASIWIGDQAWGIVLGVSDTTTQAPYQRDDFVRIASITKSYTATAVLQLVDDGALSLDDTLESFVPGIANGDAITVRQLLGMRSGVFDFTSDPEFTAAFGADPTMPWTTEDFLAVVRRNPPAFAPGEKTEYCDSNYVLLGMILEQVTGLPAGDVITNQIIEPLDLSATSYPTTAAVPEPHPTAYVPDPNDPSTPPIVVNDVNPAVAGTAGAMISTLDDLRLWGGELAGGTLLSPALQAERLQATRFFPTGINAGYGLGVERINDLIGHNGAIFGYSSIVLRYPQADMTIAVVTNASTNFTTPTTEVALQLIQELYPDQVR